MMLVGTTAGDDFDVGCSRCSGIAVVAASSGGWGKKPWGTGVP